MQKHVNLLDLVKSFPTNIFLQNLASIQKRTNPIKFAHLAEKSERGSTSNLSTKQRTSAISVLLRLAQDLDHRSREVQFGDLDDSRRLETPAGAHGELEVVERRLLHYLSGTYCAG